MPLPIALMQDDVSIYSIYSSSRRGIPAPTNYNWGIIDQVGINVWYNVGDMVLLNGKEREVVIVYHNKKYNIWPQGAILAIEQ